MPEDQRQNLYKFGARILGRGVLEREPGATAGLLPAPAAGSPVRCAGEAGCTPFASSGSTASPQPERRSRDPDTHPGTCR